MLRENLLIKLQRLSTKDSGKTQDNPSPVVSAYHKEHLALVLMGQQKETQHRGVGYLVVKGLAMQVQKGGVDPNVISASGGQTLQLPEDTDGVSSGLDHICLRQHVLGKGLRKHTLVTEWQGSYSWTRWGLLSTICSQGNRRRSHLNGVHAILLGGRYVEAHLHERNLCVIILVELQCHLVFACGALGHVAERYLKDRLVTNVKGKQLPCKEKAVKLLQKLESA